MSHSTWYSKVAWVATRAALQGENFSCSLLQRAQKRAVSREKKNKAREAEECEATPLAIAIRRGSRDHQESSTQSGRGSFNQTTESARGLSGPSHDEA